MAGAELDVQSAVICLVLALLFICAVWFGHGATTEPYERLQVGVIPFPSTGAGICMRYLPLGTCTGTCTPPPDLVPHAVPCGGSRDPLAPSRHRRSDDGNHTHVYQKIAAAEQRCSESPRVSDARHLDLVEV